jgi:hypothetical protein
MLILILYLCSVNILLSYRERELLMLLYHHFHAMSLLFPASYISVLWYIATTLFRKAGGFPFAFDRKRLHHLLLLCHQEMNGLFAEKYNLLFLNFCQSLWLHFLVYRWLTFLCKIKALLLSLKFMPFVVPLS